MKIGGGVPIFWLEITFFLKIHELIIIDDAPVSEDQESEDDGFQDFRLVNTAILL